MSHVITVDVVAPDRATGWVDYPAYGRDFPVVGTQIHFEPGKSGQKSLWTLHAGISDEYSATGETLEVAVKRLALYIGPLKGTALVGGVVVKL